MKMLPIKLFQLEVKPVKKLLLVSIKVDQTLLQQISSQTIANNETQNTKSDFYNIKITFSFNLSSFSFLIFKFAKNYWN